MGQLNRFIENMEKAHEIENRNGMVIYGLTFGYELTRQYKKMVPFLEKLLELEPEKTHYAVDAKYYQFLADGSLASFSAFEKAVKTVQKSALYDERSIENREMVVAMVNDEIDLYARLWQGKWESHYSGHGNWSCPMIINEEANQAYFLMNHGKSNDAEEFIEKVKAATSRPINEHAFCIFDKVAYEPKLFYMTGDSARARKIFDESMLKILTNNKFPRGAVEKSILLQTADMVAPDKVYSLYKEITSHTVSFMGLEVVCANPWTYPNLLKHPEFIKEVRKDGRFVKFLEHYKILRKT
jgi:tetratricopeptide (TPR) repeat protein